MSTATRPRPKRATNRPPAPPADPADVINAGSFTYRDRAGRAWDLTITYAAALRLNKLDFSEIWPKPFSFLEPSQELLQAIFAYSQTGTLLGVALIWELMSPQATAQGVTQDDWLEAMDGETMDQARQALWGAMAHFFPERRTALLTLRDLNASARTKATRILRSHLETMETRVEATLEREAQAACAQLDCELSKLSSTSQPALA